MSKSTVIKLKEIPKDDDYEDYIAAFLQAGGLYVERKIIHREIEELLELDIIATNFQKSSADKLLIEIKSGNWGFNEIFKIKGWLVYLNFKKGSFIVQKTRPSISYFKDKAYELNIELIDNSDLTKTKDSLNHLLLIQPSENEIETIRFAYLLERKLLKQLKKLKKDCHRKGCSYQSYDALDDYFFKINSGSFFSRSPIRRIKQLFDNYLKYKNITAKICNELNGGHFDDEVTELTKDCYKELFYDAKEGILHISLYIEHIARVTILKAVIEHLVNKLNGEYTAKKFSTVLQELSLPSTIQYGLNSIFKDKYFYLYPRFWQFFTYVFGGFILTDLKEQEYKILSDKTGIPVDEIPNAFDAFNKLFPHQGGWFYKFPKSSIEWHQFFPIAFSGEGANYRRMIYTKSKTYEELFNLLSNDMTNVDLIKWNNLGYRIIKDW